MNKMPKISVIMSTYNTNKEFLKSSIESILNQTYSNFEFIIVCDGSADDFNIINEYEDERIVIIKHDKSLGLTKSLNEAIKISKGEYIARMDSDDISLKNRFMIQLNFLEKNKNIDICSTFCKYIGDKNNYNIDLFYKERQKKAELFIYNRIVHPSIMIRKSFLSDNNILYNENYRYSQDYELWSRCCKITDIYVIPKVCINYRVHAGQISTAKVQEQNELCRNIYISNLNSLDFPNTDENTKYLFYLSKKGSYNISYEELKKFIDKVVLLNRKKNIYDESELIKILYYRIFAVKFGKMNIFQFFNVLVKGNIVGLILKKIFLTVKVIFFNFNKNKG